MPTPRISIIGAGISGLTLARCLSKRGLSAVLYERDTADQASKRYNYGITLHCWAYRPLLKILDFDETSFRRNIAVDAEVDSQSRISSNDGSDPASIRVNRQKFEQLLRDGLDVKWEHKIEGVETTENDNTGSNLTLRFRNGHEVGTDIVIAADGAHSQIRKSIAPSVEFNILPFAVYNGKRRVPHSTFKGKYAAAFDDVNVLEHKIGKTVLQISVNGQTDEQVNISYTYSRPARQPDPIFNSQRSNSESTSIPDELFDEIRDLEDLKDPFKDVFDADEMRNDRLLNWLMRSALVGSAELDRAAEHGVILLGDSSHPEPILGGQGANLAIQDSIELAKYIAEPGGVNIRGYYEIRHNLWKDDVERSEAQLAEMHREARHHL